MTKAVLKKDLIANMNLKAMGPESNKLGVIQMKNVNSYRYTSFTTKLLFRDMRFDKSAPKAGEPFPEFKIETTDGNTLSKQDFINRKPMLLIFGSLTCPMTASAMPNLKHLQEKFGDKVEFILLNVREAHPGECLPQPSNEETKLDHAHKLKRLYDIGWTVATDDIDGTLHRALDPKPNAVFLMDNLGSVVFRSLWSSDGDALTQALDNLVQGKPQHKTQSQKMLMPVVRAMGHVQDVMRRGGSKAVTDLWLAGFPMALAGKLATLFEPLPKDLRGIASVSALGIAMFSVIIFGGMYI